MASHTIEYIHYWSKCILFFYALMAQRGYFIWSKGTKNSTKIL